MMTPQKAAGNQATGKAKIMIAQHILQLAMIDLGVGSPQGGAILKALTALTKEFGKSEEDSKQIMPAELMQAMQSSAGPGAPPGAGKPPGGPPPGGPPPGGGMPPMQ
jgi:hypothetical protein